MLRRL